MALAKFNAAAGVHGLGVDLGSEIFTLSEAERGQVTRCEQVCYIKVESRPGTTKVADMVSVAAVGGKGVTRRA